MAILRHHSGARCASAENPGKRQSLPVPVGSTLTTAKMRFERDRVPGDSDGRRGQGLRNRDAVSPRLKAVVARSRAARDRRAHVQPPDPLQFAVPTGFEQNSTSAVASRLGGKAHSRRRNTGTLETYSVQVMRQLTTAGGAVEMRRRQTRSMAEPGCMQLPREIRRGVDSADGLRGDRDTVYISNATQEGAGLDHFLMGENASAPDPTVAGAIRPRVIDVVTVKAVVPSTSRRAECLSHCQWIGVRYLNGLRGRRGSYPPKGQVASTGHRALRTCNGHVLWTVWLSGPPIRCAPAPRCSGAIWHNDHAAIRPYSPRLRRGIRTRKGQT